MKDDKYKWYLMIDMFFVRVVVVAGGTVCHLHDCRVSEYFAKLYNVPFLYFSILVP